jgi:hypothetical protein
LPHRVDVGGTTLISNVPSTGSASSMAPITPPKALPEVRLMPRGTPIPPGTPPRTPSPPLPPPPPPSHPHPDDIPPTRFGGRPGWVEIRERERSPSTASTANHI